VSFVTVLALLTIVAFPVFILLGIAAIVFPTRRPAIYAHSPADWRIMGINVIQIAGVGAILVGAFGLFDGIYFHKEVGLKNPVLGIFMPFILLAAGGLWYVGARWYRRQHDGRDINLAFQELPPE
jgi:hypothetical protein